MRLASILYDIDQLRQDAVWNDAPLPIEVDWHDAVYVFDEVFGLLPIYEAIRGDITVHRPAARFQQN
jgi:hypothetical protein